MPRIKNVTRLSPYNRVLTVTFWTKVRKDRGFSVPQGAVRILGLHFGDGISLNVWDTSGRSLFQGNAKLSSETEITDLAVRQCLTRGMGILVTASRPV